MRSRLFTALLGFALGATLIGGISVAATKSSGTLKACRTSSGVLALASKRGTCAHGQQKVSLDVTGPRGPQGVPGPGAGSSVAASSTTTEVTGATISVAGTDLKITSKCAGNGFALVQFAGTGEYFFHGSALVNDAGSNNVDVTSVDGTSVDPTAIGDGDNIVNDGTSSTDASTVASISIENPGATASPTQVSSQLIFAVGSKTFTLSVFEFLTSSACNATAQVVPT